MPQKHGPGVDVGFFIVSLSATHLRSHVPNGTGKTSHVTVEAIRVQITRHEFLGETKVKDLYLVLVVETKIVGL